MQKYQAMTVEGTRIVHYYCGVGQLINSKLLPTQLYQNGISNLFSDFFTHIRYAAISHENNCLAIIIHIQSFTIKSQGRDIVSLWHLILLFIYMNPCVYVAQTWDMKWSNQWSGGLFDHYVTLRMLYNTLVLSLFDYGNIIHRTTDQTYLKQLQILQNKGANMFLNCHYSTHIIDMLTELNWMTVKEWADFHSTCLIYKCQNHLAHQYLVDHFNNINESHNYNTKSSTHGY